MRIGRDHRPRPAGRRRPLRDLKRSSGRRTVRLAVEGELRSDWLDAAGVESVRQDADGAELELSPGTDGDAILAAVLARGVRSRRFELAEPSLEALFIEHVGRPSDDEGGLAPERMGKPCHRRGSRSPDGPPRSAAARTPASSPVASSVTGPESALPGSTLVLMGLALIVAMAPIAIRYMDRQTVTTIAVVASEPGTGRQRGQRRGHAPEPASVSGQTAGWTKPFAIEATTEAAAARGLRRGALGGILILEPRAERPGRRHVPDQRRARFACAAQLVGFAAIAVSIHDWTASQPDDPARAAFQPPAFRIDSINVATDGGVGSIRSRPRAGRSSASSSWCCSSSRS